MKYTFYSFTDIFSIEGNGVDVVITLNKNDYSKAAEAGEIVRGERIEMAYSNMNSDKYPVFKPYGIKLINPIK